MVVEGKDIKSAFVNYANEEKTLYGVSFNLNAEGAKAFEDATREFIGQSISIYLDDELISAPTVQTVIAGGSGIITGSKSESSEDSYNWARNLAMLIQSGALPMDITEVETRAISATLGIEVKDGNRVLVLGTDYEFGQVVYASTGEGMPENVGDECLLEIKGKGDYAGSLWAPFTITIPDDGGTWGQLTWAFHAGTLTISGTGAMDAASNYSGYPWLTVASYIKAITIG